MSESRYGLLWDRYSFWPQGGADGHGAHDTLQLYNDTPMYL